MPADFRFERDYRWLDLVSARPGGETWRRRYREATRSVAGWLGKAVIQVRQGGNAAARRLLLGYGRQRRQVMRSDPDVAHVMGRFFFGSLAYFQLRVGAPRAAQLCLDAAAACLPAAMTGNPDLLPLAPICADIPLKRARIAHEAGRWDEMAEHLRVLRCMESGSLPLCVLQDGSAVDYRRLEEHFLRFPPPDEQRWAIEQVLDTEQRLERVDRAARYLHLPRELLLLYP